MMQLNRVYRNVIGHLNRALAATEQYQRSCLLFSTSIFS